MIKKKATSKNLQFTRSKKLREPYRVPLEGFGLRHEDMRAPQPIVVDCSRATETFNSGYDVHSLPDWGGLPGPETHHGVLERARAGFRQRRSARKCVQAGVGLMSTSPEVRHLGWVPGLRSGAWSSGMGLALEVGITPAERI